MCWYVFAHVGTNSKNRKSECKNSETFTLYTLTNEKNMDLRFERRYDKKVNKIAKLKEALQASPDNEVLVQLIKAEEDYLFRYIVETGKQLEKLWLNRNEESNPDWYE